MPNRKRYNKRYVNHAFKNEINRKASQMIKSQKEIKEKVLETLKDIGVCVFNEEKDKDFDLSEYILDSLLFVTFFVELESKLGFEIPDTYLSMDKFRSIDGFCLSIYEFLNNTTR